MSETDHTVLRGIRSYTNASSMSLPTVLGFNSCEKLWSLIRNLFSEWGREQAILYTKCPFATKCLYFQPFNPFNCIYGYTWNAFCHRRCFQDPFLTDNVCIKQPCLWKHNLNRLPTDQPHVRSHGCERWVSLGWGGCHQIPPADRLAMVLWRRPFYKQESVCRQRRQAYAMWRGLSQSADATRWTPGWRWATWRWFGRAH